MTRRTLLGSAGAGLLKGLYAAGSKNPNVLLIVTDDHGYGDLGCHGNPILRTPNLDALAKESIEFTRFYVSPVCAPTRASLLTGRYNLRSGVHGVTRGRETMRAEETTLAEALRGAGYRTALFGKWHLGEQYPYVPHAQGFDEFTGFRTGHWNRYFDAPLERNGKPIESDGFISDYLTNEAIRFLERNRTNPFFLYVPYNAPHSPYQVPDRFYERFARTDLSEETKVVYGMIENLDENVGRLLGAVDKLGLAEDTVVIFMTDNGPNGNRYNAGLRGVKGSVYEGGVRAPFFVRYPGSGWQPRKIDTIAAHIDVFPTVLDLCGVKLRDTLPLDGRSLVPLLKDQSSDWPDRMIFTHRERDRSELFPGAVRTQRFNLVNGRELYDMRRDPGETTDVSAEYPEITAKLRAAYESWYEKAARQCRYERLPIQVGHGEENPVTLPATQAYFDGELHYNAKNGYAHDWISGWTRILDSVWWEIEVMREGTYEIFLRYACAKENTGSQVAVIAGGHEIQTTIDRATPMEPLPNRNRVPGTHYINLAWATHAAGRLRLDKGRTRLTVRAVEKRGSTIMELKEVIMRRS